MCLITIAPKGTKKKAEDLKGFIENGMSTNTDGSGIMWKINKHRTINIKKGFRNSSDLLQFINSLNLTQNDELIIHHRIGTSGERNEINMHPFLLTDNEELLNSTEGKFNIPAMAHNGVFSDFTDRSSKYNDTWHFVKDFMSEETFVNFLKNNPEKFKDKLSKIIGTQKLAFLFPDRDFIALGSFTEDGGYYHSNGGYKSHVYDRGGYGMDYWGQARGGANDWNKNNFQFNRALSSGFSSVSSDDDDDDDDSLERVTTYNLHNSLSKKGIYEFNDSDIVITDDNYKHFRIKFFNYDIHHYIEANKIYDIVSFNEKEAAFDYIQRVGQKECLGILNLERILEQNTYNLYVKREYIDLYKGFFSLIESIPGKLKKPSKTFLKKLEKAYNNNKNRENFKYKHYGVLNTKVIQNYLFLHGRIIKESQLTLV